MLYKLSHVRGAKEEEEGDDTFEVPQAVIFEDEPALENFLNEAQHLREAINSLEAEVKRFSQQQKSLVAAMRRFSVIKKESSITQDIKRQAESIHKRLDALSKQVKQTEEDRGPVGAAARIQHAQHATLFHRFQQVMRQYNDSLVTKQDKCKDFIVRQLEVSGREVTDEEVNDMLEQGRWEIFNENVMHEAKITRTQLSEIEQRHKELVHLESNMRDLRDLFLELYLQVEAQGVHIENIQTQVEKTQDFVEITRERFKKAARYKKKNPFKKMFLCCFQPCRK
uniref:Syntaxin 19 n=1 Tax=Scleropages formosus TaxID=113540 RepID=A0A8C9R800_SCLFO